MKLKPEFPKKAPCAAPTFYRTYSRVKEDGTKENFDEVVDRTVEGLRKLGGLTSDDLESIANHQREVKITTSGRWLWVGGTEWLEKPENALGAYNCLSLYLDEEEDFFLTFDLLGQGCGVGAVIEKEGLSKLKPIVNHITLSSLSGEDIGCKYNLPFISYRGEYFDMDREDCLMFKTGENTILLVPGDSRLAWVDTYRKLWSLFNGTADKDYYGTPIPSSSYEVYVDYSFIRPKGVPIKGFGGKAQPSGFPIFIERVTTILNRVVDAGGGLSTKRASLLCCEGGKAIVAGGVRRSAEWHGFDSDDKEGGSCKENLWVENNGKWIIDPERDAFRMANHTRLFHHRPTIEEIRESVTKQHASGEGAIMFVPEAIARCNADIFPTKQERDNFIQTYVESKGHLEALRMVSNKIPAASEYELTHRMKRYLANPCVEILGYDLTCNLTLVHLESFDPNDDAGIREAFRLATLCAAPLLKHVFPHEVLQKSRDIDPIVGVCFTGLFDFLISRFGEPWLEWWMAGRPRDWRPIHQSPPEHLGLKVVASRVEDGKEVPLYGKGLNIFHYLSEFFIKEEQLLMLDWKNIVRDTLEAYCEQEGLRCPNRFTALQPSGTKGLLSGGAPGWHPSYAQYYIRRITFAREDPIAMACMRYGYKVIPGVDSKQKDGSLYEDIWDPNVTTWLVEFPIKAPWSDEVDGEWPVEDAHVHSRWDLHMQCQKYYVTHNTSTTITFLESEIEDLSQYIYKAIQNNEGYVSGALLAGEKYTFPRMPYEKISKEHYEKAMDEVLSSRETSDFMSLMNDYHHEQIAQSGGCTSDKCEIGSFLGK